MTFEELQQKYEQAQNDPKLEAERNRALDALGGLIEDLDDARRGVRQPFRGELREWVSTLDMIAANPPSTFEGPVRAAIPKAEGLASFLFRPLEGGITNYDRIRRLLVNRHPENAEEVTANFNKHLKGMNDYFGFNMDLDFIPDPEPEPEPEPEPQVQPVQNEVQPEPEPQVEPVQNEVQPEPEPQTVQTEPETSGETPEPEPQETSDPDLSPFSHAQMLSDFQEAVRTGLYTQSQLDPELLANVVVFYSHTINGQDGNELTRYSEHNRERDELMADPAFQALTNNQDGSVLSDAILNVPDFMQRLNEKRQELEEASRQETRETQETQETPETPDADLSPYTHAEMLQDIQQNVRQGVDNTQEEWVSFLAHTIVFYNHAQNPEEANQLARLSEHQKEMQELEDDPAFKSLVSGMDSEALSSAILDPEGFLRQMDDRKRELAEPEQPQETQETPETEDNLTEFTYAKMLEDVRNGVRDGIAGDDQVNLSLLATTAVLYSHVINGQDADQRADIDEHIEERSTMMADPAFQALANDLDLDGLKDAIINVPDFWQNLEERKRQLQEEQVEEEQVREEQVQEEQIEEEEIGETAAEPTEETPQADAGGYYPYTYSQRMAELQENVRTNNLGDMSREDVLAELSALAMHEQVGAGNDRVHRDTSREETAEMKASIGFRYLFERMTDEEFENACQSPGSFIMSVYSQERYLEEHQASLGGETTEKEQPEEESVSGESESGESDSGESESGDEEEEDELENEEELGETAKPEAGEEEAGESAEPEAGEEAGEEKEDLKQEDLKQEELKQEDQPGKNEEKKEEPQQEGPKVNGPAVKNTLSGPMYAASNDDSEFNEFWTEEDEKEYQRQKAAEREEEFGRDELQGDTDPFEFEVVNKDGTVQIKLPASVWLENFKVEAGKKKEIEKESFFGNTYSYKDEDAIDLMTRMMAVRMAVNAERHTGKNLDRKLTEQQVNDAVNRLQKSKHFNDFLDAYRGHDERGMKLQESVVDALEKGHGGRVEDLFRNYLRDLPAGELDNRDRSIGYFMPTAAERIESLQTQAKNKKEDIEKETAEVIVLRNMLHAEKGKKSTLEKKIPTDGDLKKDVKTLSGDPAFNALVNSKDAGIKKALTDGHGGGVVEKVLDENTFDKVLRLKEYSETTGMSFGRIQHTPEALKIIKANTRGGRMEALREEARKVGERMKKASWDEEAELENQAKEIMTEYLIHKNACMLKDKKTVVENLDKKLNETVEWSKVNEKVQKHMQDSRMQDMSVSAEAMINLADGKEDPVATIVKMRQQYLERDVAPQKQQPQQKQQQQQQQEDFQGPAIG